MSVVDFYYGVGSRYSYLAATQLAALQTDTGCDVDWQPIDSPALRARRGRDPFAGEPLSGQYEWPYRERDAARWAAYYGVPFREPRGRLALDATLLARACTAAKRLAAVEPFSRALFAAVFRDPLERVDAAECVRRAAACGLDAEAFAAALSSPDTEAAMRAATDRALRSGVFGVPTFIVDGELFWGNDRLVLLRHHLRRARAASAATD
jgi:2-hydroxychromene-2-carboxylate isomerase